MSLRANLISDGSIVGRTIAAQSITAGNGAIDSLAVKALNIQDNAVTVASVASRSDNYVGQGYLSNVISLNFSVDTTGLAGKTMFLSCAYQVAQVFTSSNNFWEYTIFYQTNGAALAINSAGGAATQITVNINAAVPFTATGGVMNFSVYVDWSGASGVIMGARSLEVKVSKR